MNPEISGHHILYKNGFPRSLSNPAFGFYLYSNDYSTFHLGNQENMAFRYINDIIMPGDCNFFQAIPNILCGVNFAALISGVIFWNTFGLRIDKFPL